MRLGHNTAAIIIADTSWRGADSVAEHLHRFRSAMHHQKVDGGVPVRNEGVRNTQIEVGVSVPNQGRTEPRIERKAQEAAIS